MRFSLGMSWSTPRRRSLRWGATRPALRRPKGRIPEAAPPRQTIPGAYGKLGAHQGDRRGDDPPRGADREEILARTAVHPSPGTRGSSAPCPGSGRNRLSALDIPPCRGGDQQGIGQAADRNQRQPQCRASGEQALATGQGAAPRNPPGHGCETLAIGRAAVDDHPLHGTSSRDRSRGGSFPRGVGRSRDHHPWCSFLNRRVRSGRTLS
jgi:hypothetical protein